MSLWLWCPGFAPFAVRIMWEWDSVSSEKAGMLGEPKRKAFEKDKRVLLFISI